MMQHIQTIETLTNKIGRWKRALSDAATGPLVIAPEVVALADNWEAIKEEAGGLSCTAYLRSKLHPGRDLAFFRRRAEAVAKLGEASRRTLHHDVAVWVANQVPDNLLDAVKLELIRGAKEQNGHPLVMSQARARLKQLIGSTARKKRECQRCKELEKLLATHGIETPGKNEDA